MALTEKQKAQAKKRSALHRRRRAKGMVVVKIVIPENAQAEALMDEGLLAADADTPEELAEAIEKFLRHHREFVTRDARRQASRGTFQK